MIVIAANDDCAVGLNKLNYRARFRAITHKVTQYPKFIVVLAQRSASQFPCRSEMMTIFMKPLLWLENTGFRTNIKKDKLDGLRQ